MGQVRCIFTENQPRMGHPGPGGPCCMPGTTESWQPGVWFDPGPTESWGCDGLRSAGSRKAETGQRTNLSTPLKAPICYPELSCSLISHADRSRSHSMRLDATLSSDDNAAWLKKTRGLRSSALAGARFPSAVHACEGDLGADQWAQGRD
ncbi:hypothetical protein BC834DRAFT_505000 [Gloeopeniophorella convolvens]|nr:hypothetical protein BC834DRAFT_505000 [Gloeopeniophorella convolvens]